MLGLFILAPLVAEFLLGNIAIDAWWVLPIVAPLYGGGAIVVRETARRFGGSAKPLLLLATAFAVIEEAFVTQSLFNPSYFGVDLLAWAPLPALGIGAWWTVYVVTLHAVWSIAVPIAFVEHLAGDAQAPWLGRAGLSVAGATLAVGGVVNFVLTHRQEGFVASLPQLLGAAVVVVALMAAAVGAGQGAPAQHVVSATSAPTTRRVGVTSFGASILFALGLYLPGWWTVGFWLVLIAAAVATVRRWSTAAGWRELHRLALAAGALMAQALQGFPHAPAIGSGGRGDLIGNAVFALGAGMLWWCAHRRVRNRERSRRRATTSRRG